VATLNIYESIKTLRLSSLLGSSFVYISSSVLNKLVPILLLPILTRYLDPASYGLTTIFFILLAVATPLTGLNINTAIFRKYYDQQNTDLAQYISSCLVVLVSSTVLVAVVTTLASKPISALTKFPGSWLIMGVLTAACNVVVNVLQDLAKAKGRPYHFALLVNGQTLLTALLTLVLVVGFHLSWQGVILASFSGAIALAAASMGVLIKLKLVCMTYNREYLWNAIKYGLPLVPHLVGAIGFTLSDRIIISNIVGLESVGVYSLGFQIGSVVSVLASSFNTAWMPWLFDKLRRDGAARGVEIVRLIYLYFVLLVSFAVLHGCFSFGLLKPLFGASFAGAGRFVFWISLAFAFQGMYQMVSGFIFYSEKTHVLSWITPSVGLLSILANIVLVREFGAIGAAYTATLSYLVFFLVTWYASNRVYRMPWNPLGLRGARVRQNDGWQSQTSKDH